MPSGLKPGSTCRSRSKLRVEQRAAGHEDQSHRHLRDDEAPADTLALAVTGARRPITKAGRRVTG